MLGFCYSHSQRVRHAGLTETASIQGRFSVLCYVTPSVLDWCPPLPTGLAPTCTVLHM